MKTQKEIYQELLQLSKNAWERQYKTSKDKTNRLANIYAVLNTVETCKRQYNPMAKGIEVGRYADA